MIKLSLCNDRIFFFHLGDMSSVITNTNITVRVFKRISPNISWLKEVVCIAWD